MKITWEGKRFILAAVLIAVTAVNTGNNLIYLIFSLMISIILLAALLLHINISRLSLSASAEHPVFAGEKTNALFALRNRKKILPAYSLYLTAQGASAPVYCSLIPPKSSAKKQIEITFGKRGIYSYGPFSVRSGFPFIIFEKSTAVPASGEVLVYPALMDVEEFMKDLSVQDHMEEGKMAVGSGIEMYLIREFRYGDDRRNIHWKATAKASALMVKEYALTDTGKVTIIIDNLLPSEGAAFEKIISLAGSFARYFLDSGFLVRVISCKKVIPFGSGTEHLFNVLDILALMQEEDAMDCLMAHDSEGFTMLLLKSGNPGFSNYLSSSDIVIYAESL